MSRAYRVKVSESTHRHIRVADGVQARLDTLPILAPEQMAELLAAELEALGFERDGDVLTRDDDSGVRLEIDVANGTVTARLAAETEVDVEVTMTRVADRNRREQELAALREDARAALEDKVEARRRKLTGEVTRKLEQALADARAELDRATTRAAARALEIRARQLGEIQQISEDPETGELTIRVKV